jgi:hypothetical protein
LLGGTASPETIVAGDPIFRPIGMDYVLLNVSDPEKSAEFFARIVGPVMQRSKNRIWFQVGKSRIGLMKTPEGGRAGVNRYCVQAQGFNYADATKKLTLAGAKMEKAEELGSPEFRDPDGYLVQVNPEPLRISE